MYVPISVSSNKKVCGKMYFEINNKRNHILVTGKFWKMLTDLTVMLRSKYVTVQYPFIISYIKFIKTHLHGVALSVIELKNI